jgi:hypothetical protein
LWIYMEVKGKYSVYYPIVIPFIINNPAICPMSIAL